MNTFSFLRVFCWTVLFFVFNAGTYSQTANPILRIETGMHQQLIIQSSLDEAEQFLATASLDKTVRIWDLTAGKLVRVIRMPIGEGWQGVPSNVCISPDGSLIAVISIESPLKLSEDFREKPNVDKSVYLFDRTSGRQIKKIIKTDLSDPVNFKPQDIVFSKDSKSLGIAAGNLVVYSIKQNSLQEVSGEVNKYDLIEPFGTEQFVLTSQAGNNITYFGFDRYSNRWKKTANFKLPVGKIFSLRFSPDEAQFAVLAAEPNKENVSMKIYKKDRLVPFFETDDIYASDSSFFWSKDGTEIILNYNKKNLEYMKSWNLLTGKSFDPIPLGDIRFGIKELNNGDALFVHPYGQIFTVSDNGQIGFIIKKRFVLDRMQNDNLSGFNVSPNGAAFQQCSIAEELPDSFQLKSCPTFESFDIFDRSFNYNLNEFTNWKEKSNAASNFNLTLSDNINGFYYLKVNGKQTKVPIADKKLFQDFHKKLIQTSADKNFILVSNMLRLFLLNKNGDEIWSKELEDLNFRSKISEDGKLVVAAFINGVYKWFRMSDGKELLTMHLGADKRWVIWTPSGYYDASPGGEELIGWQVNNGKDTAADFYPVGLFRNRFYRPDVVSNVLKTLDETEALRVSNEISGRREQNSSISNQLPPVVEILNPKDGTELSGKDVRIRYKVRSAEPIINVKALINGRPANFTKDLSVQSATEGELRLTVPENDVEISIIAENRFAKSVPANIRLKWKGKIPEINYENLKPKLYILAIGVKNYANPSFDLGYPDKDAKDFVAEMVKQKGKLYRDIEVKLLTNADATRDTIVDGLDWIAKATTSRDVAMIYWSGHGINDNLNRYYFAPYNFNTESILRTGVSSSDIRSAIEAIAGKAILFIDSCHSGNSIGNTIRSKDGAVDINGFVNEISSAENGAVVFNSSTGRQTSIENSIWENGAFTQALVEGLAGAAALNVTGKDNGKISINSLNLFISERVKELTQGRQTPTTVIPPNVPDFPIAAKF